MGIDPDRSPIFVVGTGRSGTTLLRMMINAHPRIHLTHEASYYLGLAGVPRRATAEQRLQHYEKSFSYAFMGVSMPEVLARMAGPPPHPFAEGFRALMRAVAEKHGKPRYGDKTPSHAFHLKRIFADFPEARVIHVVRDPRAAVASLDRMPWGAASTALNAIFCDWQVRAIQPFAKRICEVKLEDLMREPERVMRAILDHVGEEWSAQVLDHEHFSPGDDLPPFPWFQDARGNIRPTKGQSSWRRQLDPEWIRIVERKNALTMRVYGYGPERFEKEPTRIQQWKAQVRDLPNAWRSLRDVWRLSRRGRAPDPQADMEALLRLNPRAMTYYPALVIPRLPGRDERATD